MDTRNAQAQSIAFRKTKGKIQKILELGIMPDMSKEDQDALIELLADAKAKSEGGRMEDYVKGQRWYVENLVSFSALSVDQQFELEYSDAFGATASESELMAALRALTPEPTSPATENEETTEVVSEVTSNEQPDTSSANAPEVNSEDVPQVA